MHLRRRGYLRSLPAITGTVAGCSTPFRGSSTRPTVGTEPVTIEKRDFTGDGTDDIRLGNGRITVQMEGERMHGLEVISEMARTGESRVTGNIRTRPKTPISRTESVHPEFQNTVKFDVVENRGEMAVYRIDRNYRLNGAKMNIRCDVSLVSGQNFVFVDYSFENRSSRELLLDQDKGDRHDGIQIYRHLRLFNQNRTNDAYRFYLPSIGERTFLNQPVWKVFRGTRWGTIFDLHVGVTAGLVEWETPPWMWITELNATALDYLVGELVLKPDESASYVGFVGLHEGGGVAPEAGKRTHSRAKQVLNDL